MRCCALRETLDLEAHRILGARSGLICHGAQPAIPYRPLQVRPDQPGGRTTLEQSRRQPTTTDCRCSLCLSGWGNPRRRTRWIRLSRSWPTTPTSALPPFPAAAGSCPGPRRPDTPQVDRPVRTSPGTRTLGAVESARLFHVEHQVRDRPRRSVLPGGPPLDQKSGRFAGIPTRRGYRSGVGSALRRSW